MDDLARAQAGAGGDLDSVLVFNLQRTHNDLSPFLNPVSGTRRLTAAQFNALLALRAAGRDGLRMGEIGRRLVVTKSNVTGLVDRLERQGLVLRAGQPDRRATVVRLTGAGARLIAGTAPRQDARLAELTRCLAVREKRTLIRLLTKLRRELRLRRAGGSDTESRRGAGFSLRPYPTTKGRGNAARQGGARLAPAPQTALGERTHFQYTRRRAGGPS